MWIEQSMMLTSKPKEIEVLTPHLFSADGGRLGLYGAKF